MMQYTNKFDTYHCFKDHENKKISLLFAINASKKFTCRSNAQPLCNLMMEQ